MQHGVAVRKRAPLHILPAHAHNVFFVEQRAVGQQFARRPVQDTGFEEHLTALPQQVINLLDGLEAVGNRGQGLGYFFHGFGGNTGFGRLLKVLGRATAQAAPLVLQSLVLVRQRFLLHQIEAGLQGVAKLPIHVGGQLGVHVAALHQHGIIHLARVLVLRDNVVKRGLRELGLVRLVVAVAAVAHHINEDIGVKLLAVFGGQLHGKHHGFGVVAVHVHHRRIDDFGQIRRID